MKTLTSLELCAGGGGQAIGVERAGFEHVGLVEIDQDACETLRANRSHWNVIQADLKSFDAAPFKGVDLIAGGVPCPPFSVAGKQLGKHDDRDLFPSAIRIIKQCQPKSLMLENVKGLLSPKFASYFQRCIDGIKSLGYYVDYSILNACNFGVPQLRPRLVIVGLRPDIATRFIWPSRKRKPKSVGDVLYEEMSSLGWALAPSWREKANYIAPTIVGGSKKHGGPDLGPTRAKRAWKELGVDANVLANAPPEPGFEGEPRLTVKMVALLQGFPKSWRFVGGKTSAYRQVGNAFPPPVAAAVAKQIGSLISGNSTTTETENGSNSQFQLADLLARQLQ